MLITELLIHISHSSIYIYIRTISFFSHSVSLIRVLSHVLSFFLSQTYSTPSNNQSNTHIHRSPVKRLCVCFLSPFLLYRSPSAISTVWTSHTSSLFSNMKPINHCIPSNASSLDGRRKVKRQYFVEWRISLIDLLDGCLVRF